MVLCIFQPIICFTICVCHFMPFKIDGKEEEYRPKDKLHGMSILLFGPVNQLIQWPVTRKWRLGVADRVYQTPTSHVFSCIGHCHLRTTNLLQQPVIGVKEKKGGLEYKNLVFDAFDTRLPVSVPPCQVERQTGRHRNRGRQKSRKALIWRCSWHLSVMVSFLLQTVRI